MLKKSVYFLAVLFLPVFLFAGGGGQQQAKGSNYMRLAWWGNTTIDEETIQVVELFQKLNPGITIETEAAGWSGYWDKLNTQAAAGNLPDLIQHDYSYIMQWYSRNQLKDLTPYIDQGVIRTSKISEGNLAGGRINGKIYAVSLGTNAFGQIYDTAILERAGIGRIDSANWTWADFERIAHTVYEKTGIKTLPLTGGMNILTNMVRQTGKSFFSADGKTLGFTDQALIKEFFDIQLRLLEAGILYDPEDAGLTVSVAETPFSRGLTWNMYYWSNQVVDAARAANRSIEICLLPKIAGAQRFGTYLKPSMFFTIPSGAQNPDLAAKALDYFVNDLEANTYLKADRGVPVPDDVRAFLASKVDPLMKQSFDFVDLVGVNSSPIDPPDPPASGEIQAFMATLMSQVLTKSISSTEGTDRFFTRINQILAGN
jgi:multiple sugar transport system substrate-binding protein